VRVVLMTFNVTVSTVELLALDKIDERMNTMK
jgi:hypothetical protein